MRPDMRSIKSQPQHFRAVGLHREIIEGALVRAGAASRRRFRSGGSASRPKPVRHATARTADTSGGDIAGNRREELCLIVRDANG